MEVKENLELRNKQKQEAIERLKILENDFLLHKNVLKEFKDDGTVYYSENLGGAFCGILYWLENKKEFVNKVKELEEKHDIFIYHCALSHTNCGDMLSMLYISNDEEYWNFDKEQLKDGYADAYVWNLTFELDSEFGTIGFDGVNGGIVRRF